MSKKKLVILAIIFIIISIISFLSAFKTSEVVIDFSDPAYSYLPESAKNFIENEAKKGNKVLTEKNKEPKKIYLNPKYVEYLKLSDDDKQKLEVIPQTYTFDYVSLKTAKDTYSTYYKLDNLTVKDQSTLGICWAFATISSIETNILTTGLSSNVVNFSERQLDYAMSNAITEIDNPYSMTKIKTGMSNYYELNSHDLGAGASFVEAYKYLNMGISPIKEEIWGEYDTSYRTRSINEVLNYDSVDYQVSSYVVYGDNIYNKTNYSDTLKQQFMNSIKNHVTRYGSLYVVTVSPDSKAGSCFNQNKLLIDYDPEREDCKSGTYHAMALVGWDDEYDGTGAWILKNSWGSSLPYIYLSYNSDFYDISGVIKTDVKNWDNGYNFTKKHTANYTSNAYEVTYYKSAEFKENLEKINFLSWGIESTYKIYYKNGTGSYKLLKTVSNDLPGLITIDVTGVVLDKSTFSIKITTNDGFIDGDLNAFTSNVTNDKYLETYKFTSSATALPEQLIVRNVESGTKVNYYIYDEYGMKYNNDSTSYVVNGTVDIAYELPSLKSGNYYLTLDDNFFNINTTTELELKVDSTYQIEYETGSNLNVKTITFSVENPNVASVSDTGFITALKSGKTIVNLNINDNIIIPIEVKVYKESDVDLLKILEDNQTIYLSLLSELDLHLMVNPTTYSASDFDWISSDTSIATVVDGKVKFLKGGSVTITVSSGNLTDNITFDIISSTSNVELNAEKTTISIDEEIRLTHTTGTFGYRYSTSDDSVLRVRNGVVTGLKNGSAWVYYRRGNDVAGILINVIDSLKKMNLSIDPNGGIYNASSEITSISDNSLTVVSLDKPTYNVTLTLINGEDIETINISHEFNKFNLLGYGILNELNYTFGFGDDILTALWNYQSYTLPLLENGEKVFAGWYKNPELTEYFGKNINFVPKSDMTLYAKFEDAKIGDINSDNEIDITDLVILRKSLAGLEELNEKENLAADINRDNTVDITDLVILRKYLAGLEEIG